MKWTISLLGLLSLGPAGCDRGGPEVSDIPAKSERVIAPRGIPAISAEAPSGLTDRIASAPPERRIGVLAEEIYQVEDAHLDLVLESIAAQDEPALRSELLATVYEETQLRPAIARLPLLLELARHGDLAPSLRATILAELGVTLNAEHGTSWADWALALEEHLAESEGLIRSE